MTGELLRQAGSRLAGALGLIVGVTILAFLIARALPGDPAEAILGMRATPELLHQLRHQFGLDQTLPAQYIAWIAKAVHGDFGTSMATSGAATGATTQPVSAIVAQGLAVTLPLAILGTGMAALIGVPFGLVAAASAGRALDTGVSTASIVGLSVPPFYLAYLLILVFTVRLGWLPSVGYVTLGTSVAGFLSSVALPVLTIGIINAAPIARAARATAVEANASPSIALTRIEGLPPAVIQLKHILRRCLSAVLTVVGLQFGYLLGGVIVIENMFSIPGMGRQLLIAAEQRDYFVLQALIVVFAAVFVLVNLAVDLIQIATDPRQRAHAA